MDIDRISVLCFAASYGVALALELLTLLRLPLIPRLLSVVFGAAGLLAHTLYLSVQHPPLASREGSLLFLAWILAVFYLYGTLHHRKLAWGLFVLPLVLGLIGLAVLFPPLPHELEPRWLFRLFPLEGEHFWGAVHASLLLAAAVGVCIGFLASVMYLVQSQRLMAKTSPRQGLRLLSLERLEAMNRRAIVLAFPLLTIGVVVGLVLMVTEQFSGRLRGWTDPRVSAAMILWLDFVILLYLRYSLHVLAAGAAWLTILAFVLLLVTLVVPHTLSGGGLP